MRIKSFLSFATAFSSLLILGACSSDSSSPPPPPAPPPPPPAMASYAVTVTNLTNAQPLSPVAVVAHQSGFAVFDVGMPASAGLEVLAEDGDNGAFITAADADAAVTVTASGAGAIGPAGSETVSVTLLDSARPGLRISVASMLVNTNDAFTAVNGVAVDTLAVGGTMTLNLIAYDAGTEADTELATQIPGPAAGGEGFNALRDDEADQVAMHSGVVSMDDGFATSDLTNQHRFDNPVARVVIERTN